MDFLKQPYITPCTKKKKERGKGKGKKEKERNEKEKHPLGRDFYKKGKKTSLCVESNEKMFSFYQRYPFVPFYCGLQIWLGLIV